MNSRRSFNRSTSYVTSSSRAIDHVVSNRSHIEPTEETSPKRRVVHVFGIRRCGGGYGKSYVKESGELFAEDLAEELAMIPELPAESSELIDVEKMPIGTPENTPEEINQMRDVLRPNIDIF